MMLGQEDSHMGKVYSWTPTLYTHKNQCQKDQRSKCEKLKCIMLLRNKIMDIASWLQE